MKLRKRIAVGLLPAAFIGGTLASAPAAQASSPGEVSTQSCYGSAKSYTAVYLAPGIYEWPASPGWAYATSNCNDINVKPTNGSTKVRTCFDPTSGDVYCNAWRSVPDDTWGEAASDVANGTKFYLEFDRASRGYVAY